MRCLCMLVASILVFSATGEPFYEEPRAVCQRTGGQSRCEGSACVCWRKVADTECTEKRENSWECDWNQCNCFKQESNRETCEAGGMRHACRGGSYGALCICRGLEPP